MVLSTDEDINRFLDKLSQNYWWSAAQVKRMKQEAIHNAIDVLKQGGLVAFPTETVYGLGARAFDPAAVSRIFQVKGRPADNPLIVHVAEQDQLSLVVSEAPPIAKRLMNAFWPGPLTLVLKRSPQISPLVSAGLDTVAVRSPDHPLALALIRGLGEPIAAPSANRSGRPSPTRADHVRADLGERVDLILDGGPCRVGLESTVLDLTGDLPRVLRPGGVTVEAIRSVLGPTPVLSQSSQVAVPRSPGLKHRHYAPELSIILVPPDAWTAALNRWRDSGKRLGVLCVKESLDREGPFYYQRICRHELDYARNLFSAFWEAEQSGVEVLLAETVEKKGLGIALMDRLERAARGKS